MWWEDDQFDPLTFRRFAHGQAGDRIWAKVSERKPAGPSVWWVVDYRDGIDRRRVIADDLAENFGRAKEAAENAAVNYARKPGRRPLTGTPQTSTERNRFRSERLVAKESAADLSVTLLQELYRQLCKDKREDLAQDVENIMRRTALRAFAIYSRRVAKFLASRRTGKEGHSTNNRMEALVAELDLLSGPDQSGISGGAIYRRFDEIVRQMKGYGFLAESSLVRDVSSACHFTRIPGPIYNTGSLFPVPMVDTSWMIEQGELYQAHFGHREEYIEDLDGIDKTFSTEQD